MVQRVRHILSPRESVRLLAAGRWDYWLYLLQLRLKGVDVESVSLEELRLSPERSVDYRDSGGPDLARVLKSLKIKPASFAIDFGCGKAGAIITLAKFAFDGVTGLEISPELIRVARENVARMGLRNVDFVCSDAAAFKELDRYTHVYMYNPFPVSVVEQVLRNLGESLRRNARPMTLIYRNPVGHNAVLGTGLFLKTNEFQFRENSHPFFVYGHS